MKSYLTGNPALKLILSEDVTMAESNSIGSVILDDCNFHECVNYSEFLMNKSLRIDPPEGEFVVMNYRITSDFVAPFKVFAFFETVNKYKTELTIKLKFTFPKNTTALFVSVKFNVPKKASGVPPNPQNNQNNQKADFNENDHEVEWLIKKMPGETEYTYRENGPISFLNPNVQCLKLQMKSLKVLQGDENPAKWKPWRRW